MLKRQNPLTAEGAKSLRKVRKEIIINALPLRPLRNPWRPLRLR